MKFVDRDGSQDERSDGRDLLESDRLEAGRRGQRSLHAPVARRDAPAQALKSGRG